MSARNTFWIISGEKGETKSFLSAVYSTESGELLNYYSLNATKRTTIHRICKKNSGGNSLLKLEQHLALQL
jgi:hypothetical protein